MQLPNMITHQQLQDAAKALGLDTAGILSIHADTEHVTAVYRVKGKDGKSLVVNGELCFQEHEIPVYDSAVTVPRGGIVVNVEPSSNGSTNEAFAAGRASALADQRRRGSLR